MGQLASGQSQKEQCGPCRLSYSLPILYHFSSARILKYEYRILYGGWNSVLTSKL
jgi:hypothetical protein